MFLLDGNYSMYKEFIKEGTVDDYIILIKEKMSKNEVKK